MKNILIDLNIDGDCTNLGALSVLNVYCSRGLARIIASTACFNSPLATGCIKAINRYYGHPDIPVGILHRQDATHPTPFMAPVNEKFCPEHPQGEDAPDSVTVMRRALAAEPDGSVIFVIVGCFASAAALLQSPPDEISPLSGEELAARKITRVLVMGGQFPTYGDKTMGENNIIVQIPAAKYFVEHWKGEIAHTGFEIGIRTRSLKEFRFHGSEDHPLRMMYRINDGDGFLDGNPSWDHTAVMEAVEPGKYFTMHEPGRIEVTDDGVTVWHAEEGGKQTYFLPKLPLTDVANAINDMIFPEWRDFA